MDPAALKYAASHEWIHLDGDIATIGISDFAVKAVSDLYAPVAGEVTEVNSSLEEDLDPLTDDPFGAGWIIRLKVTDAAGLETLMDQAAYKAHCAAEEH